MSVSGELLDAFQEDLQSSSSSVKVNAIKNLPTLVDKIGVESSVNIVIPFVLMVITDFDEDVVVSSLLEQFGILLNHYDGELVSKVFGALSEFARSSSPNVAELACRVISDSTRSNYSRFAPDTFDLFDCMSHSSVSYENSSSLNLAACLCKSIPQASNLRSDVVSRLEGVILNGNIFVKRYAVQVIPTIISEYIEVGGVDVFSSDICRLVDIFIEISENPDSNLFTTVMEGVPALIDSIGFDIRILKLVLRATKHSYWRVRRATVASIISLLRIAVNASHELYEEMSSEFGLGEDSEKTIKFDRVESIDSIEEFSVVNSPDDGASTLISAEVDTTVQTVPTQRKNVVIIDRLKRSITDLLIDEDASVRMECAFTFASLAKLIGLEDALELVDAFFFSCLSWIENYINSRSNLTDDISIDQFGNSISEQENMFGSALSLISSMTKYLMSLDCAMEKQRDSPDVIDDSESLCHSSVSKKSALVLNDMYCKLLLALTANINMSFQEPITPSSRPHPLSSTYDDLINEGFQNSGQIVGTENGPGITNDVKYIPLLVNLLQSFPVFFPYISESNVSKTIVNVIIRLEQATSWRIRSSILNIISHIHLIVDEDIFIMQLYPLIKRRLIDRVCDVRTSASYTLAMIVGQRDSTFTLERVLPDLIGLYSTHSVNRYEGGDSISGATDARDISTVSTTTTGYLARISIVYTLRYVTELFHIISSSISQNTSSVANIETPSSAPPSPLVASSRSISGSSPLKMSMLNYVRVDFSKYRDADFLLNTKLSNVLFHRRTKEDASRVTEKVVDFLRAAIHDRVANVRLVAAKSLLFLLPNDQQIKDELHSDVDPLVRELVESPFNSDMKD